VPLERRHEPTDDTRDNRTHSYVEGLEPIASGCTKRQNLGTGVGNIDLEITIRVFLFKDKTDGFLNIDEESARGGAALLIVGQSTLREVPIFLEYRTFGSMPR
jgi:hypothetical protein